MASQTVPAWVCGNGGSHTKRPGISGGRARGLLERNWDTAQTGCRDSTESNAIILLKLKDSASDRGMRRRAIRQVPITSRPSQRNVRDRDRIKRRNARRFLRANREGGSDGGRTGRTCPPGGRWFQMRGAVSAAFRLGKGRCARRTFWATRDMHAH